MFSKNKLSIGSWLTIGHPIIAEIMSDSGFDWLCVDMEHTSIDYAQAQTLITIIQGKGKTAYVRVGENNTLIIKRVLDAGADGVIVPMIKTKEDAEKAVNSVHYPPLGKRGVGLGRAQGYGFSFKEYLIKQKNLDVIVQIEHIDSIKNLKSILSVPGIKGTIIGPYDLSASIGIPGEYDDKNFKKLITEYERESLKSKVPMGYHIVEPDVRKFMLMKNKGYEILAFSFDAMFLGNTIQNKINIIKESGS